MVAFGILNLVLTFISLTGATFNPLSWLFILQSLWMVVLGLIVAALQSEIWEASVLKGGAFLASRIGRGLFYLFSGTFGGIGFVSHAEIWWTVIGYTVFGFCVFMGILEVIPCMPRREGSSGLKEHAPPKLTNNL